MSLRIRQHIKRWIHEWDLKRLYDYEADIEISELRQDYTEMPDLETPPEDEPNEGDVNS